MTSTPRNRPTLISDSNTTSHSQREPFPKTTNPDEFVSVVHPTAPRSNTWHHLCQSRDAFESRAVPWSPDVGNQWDTENQKAAKGMAEFSTKCFEKNITEYMICTKNKLCNSSSLCHRGIMLMPSGKPICLMLHWCKYVFFRSAVRYHGCSALMAEAGHRYIFFVMHQDQGWLNLDGRWHEHDYAQSIRSIKIYMKNEETRGQPI